jgi:hypothetical protein
MLYVLQYRIIVETLVMPFSAEVHRTEARVRRASDFTYLRQSRGFTEIPPLKEPQRVLAPLPYRDLGMRLYGRSHRVYDP